MLHCRLDLQRLATEGHGVADPGVGRAENGEGDGIREGGRRGGRGRGCRQPVQEVFTLPVCGKNSESQIFCRNPKGLSPEMVWWAPILALFCSNRKK